MDIPRTTRSGARIGLTPLIDLVFLLIVFFMLTTSFSIYDSIDIGFGGGAGETTPAQEPLTVGVLSSDNLVFEGASYGLYELREVLKRRINNHKDITVIIKAGSEASVQDIIFVVDQIHLSGAADIMFME